MENKGDLYFSKKDSFFSRSIMSKDELEKELLYFTEMKNTAKDDDQLALQVRIDEIKKLIERK